MKKRLSILMMTMLLGTASSMAVPAHKKPIQVTQPDGTTVTIKLHGDEWMHFNTTADGYSVVKNQQGYYVYAEKKNGELKATSMVAHDATKRKANEVTFLQNIKKYQAPEMSEEVTATKKRVEQQQRETLAKHRAASQRAAQYDYNNFKGLVILVQFNDKSFSREDYATIAYDMMNQENYTGYDNEVYTGSVRDYFSDNSGGNFNPEFDVYGPYTVNYSQYDGNNKTDKILNAAINAANDDIDYSQYDRDGNGFVDMIYFLIAGNGSNYSGNDSRLFWPHRSCITQNNQYVVRDGVKLWDYASSVELYGWTSQPSTVYIDGIGTICHEFSHVLGLPDFYDTDYEGSGGQSNDPGDWSLMASGSYFNNGRSPVGYSLYERYSVGFTDEPEVISETGDYTLEPLANNQKGYRLNTPVAKEFFLLENRQRNKFKWDAYLPGDGMLVHRVDFTNEAMWQNNQVNARPSHNYYEILRADGAKSSASNSDPFPGTKRVHELTNGTSPANLKTWAGKNNQYGLFNIQQTASRDITFTVSTYNLTALTIDNEITIGAGMAQQITETPTPQYAEYTLTWKSSDDGVATVDEHGFLKGISTGTCVITATSSNNIEATCNVTVVDMPSYTINEFKQLGEGEKALLKLEDAQVLFTYTKNNQQTTYLRDQSGAIMVNDVSMSVKNNDIVNGKLYLKNTIKNEVPQLVGMEGETDTSGLTVIAGSEAQPREVAFDELSAADYNDLVIVKGVKVKRENGYWAYSDNTDNTARIWAGNLGVSTGLKSSTQLDGKFFDVTAIYGTNVLNNNLIKELNVTKAVQEGSDPTGIEQVESSKVKVESYYNLAGQRVNNGYKGLVIKNGKKHMNK